MDAGSSLTTIIAVAGSAAAASVVGGLIALWRESTTLFMSIARGFASGVLLGWFLLRDVGRTVLSFLFATGAGRMFYLTITELVPESEKRQYPVSRVGRPVDHGWVRSDLHFFIVAQLT
jgi:hypothetical protein